MRKKCFVVFFLFITVLCVLIANPRVKAEGSNKSVEVGVLIINISDVDPTTNTYGLDFFIEFRFNSFEFSLEDIKEFIFINSAIGAGPVQKNEIIADEEHGIYSMRVQGIFYGDFDYSKYPFDVQILPVVLEHKYLNTSFISFQANPDSKIDEAVEVPGWNINSFYVKVSEKSYYNDTFSQFVFDVELSRPVLSSIIKNILPLAIFSVMAILVYLISFKNASERIAVLTILLVTVIAFHLSITNGLSSGSYLTFFDEIMLGVYLIFLYIFSESIYMTYLFERKQVEKAEKVDRRAVIFLLILLILLAIILTFAFQL